MFRLIFKRFLLALWFIWTCWFTYVTNSQITLSHNLLFDILFAFLIFNAIPLYLLHNRRRKRNARLLAMLNGRLEEAFRKNAQFWIRMEKIAIFITLLVGLYAISWTLNQVPSLREVPQVHQNAQFVKGPTGPLISWAEVRRQSSTPRTWRTCSVINVYVNPGSSKNALALTKKLLKDVNSMTQLNFQYAGLSESVPPVVNGALEKSVLVAFYTEAVSRKGFEFGDALGRAFAYRDGDISSGYIGIKMPEFDEVSPHMQEQILAHEFGHILGLAHTTIPTDLMAPIAIGHESTFNKTVRKWFKDHPGCKR